MQSRQIFTGRDIFFFLGQLIVMVVCIWYINFIYFQDIYPDKVVGDTYSQAQCLIVDEKLSSASGTFGQEFRADFLVSYVANSETYQIWSSANGLDRSFTSDRSQEIQNLNQFIVGQTYPCWYNPAVPQQVVLVLRHNWASTFPLLIPSVIGLISLYYLVLSVFRLVTLTMTGMRKPPP